MQDLFVYAIFLSPVIIPSLLSVEFYRRNRLIPAVIFWAIAVPLFTVCFAAFAKRVFFSSSLQYELAELLLGAHWFLLAFLCVQSAVVLILWAAIDVVRSCKTDWGVLDLSHFLNRRFVLWVGSVLLVIVALCFYLDHYITIYDAVKAGDVPLVKRRLIFSIEGCRTVAAIPTISDSGFYENALTIALERGNTKTADLLLKHGFDPDHFVLWDKRRFLHRQRYLVLAFLIGPPISGWCRDIRSFSSVDRHSMLEYMLKQGADPNAQGAIPNWEVGVAEMSLLQYAAGATEDWRPDRSVKPDVGAIRLLLRYGADPNQMPSRRAEIPILAWAYPNRETMELLLDHGADVNATLSIEGKKMTLLDWVIEHGDTQMAQFLTEHGAKRFLPAS